MRITLYLIASLFVFSCSQTSEKTTTNQVDKIKNGIVEKIRPDKSKVIVTFKNGKLNGEIKEYYPNGTI
jgi:antitoxin component YwqK of YwqJK toxin-antitoxin module